MKVTLVGDLSLGEHYFNFGDGVRSCIQSGEDVFEGISEIISGTDLLIGNLECVVSPIEFDEGNPRERVFRANESALDIFDRFPITVLNVANNHSLEHGIECFQSMISACEKKGIIVCGIERNNGVATLEINNQIISIVGASLVKDDKRAPADSTYYQPSIDNLCDELFKLSKISDFLILNIHWGHEDRLRVSRYQRQLAKRFVECGVHVIVGHHPHILYEIESYRDGFACYSLGDILFDLTWNKYIRLSGLVQFDILDGKIENKVVHGVSIKKSGKPFSIYKSMNIVSEGVTDFYKFQGELPRSRLRKVGYMIKNLHKGDSMVKTRFLLWKLKDQLLK